MAEEFSQSGAEEEESEEAQKLEGEIKTPEGLGIDLREASQESLEKGGEFFEWAKQKAEEGYAGVWREQAERRIAEGATVEEIQKLRAPFGEEFLIAQETLLAYYPDTFPAEEMNEIVDGVIAETIAGMPQPPEAPEPEDARTPEEKERERKVIEALQVGVSDNAKAVTAEEALKDYEHRPSEEEIRKARMREVFDYMAKRGEIFSVSVLEELEIGIDGALRFLDAQIESQEGVIERLEELKNYQEEKTKDTGDIEENILRLRTLENRVVRKSQHLDALRAQYATLELEKELSDESE